MKPDDIKSLAFSFDTLSGATGDSSLAALHSEWHGI